MTVPQPLLEGRRILVTGAATGIGAAAVRVLHAAGAHLAATYHRAAPGDDAPAVKWLQCDVRDADSVDAAFGEAVAELGGLDVLVNAAGSWQPGVPGHITGDEVDFLLATNVKATILTNQAAHAVMRGNGGQIINFGSAEAVMGSPIAAVYAATKGAVQAWTRSAAKAWGAEQITVNALAPAVQTPGADRFEIRRCGRIHRSADEVCLSRWAASSAIPPTTWVRCWCLSRHRSQIHHRPADTVDGGLAMVGS